MCEFTFFCRECTGFTIIQHDWKSLKSEIIFWGNEIKCKKQMLGSANLLSLL